MVLWTSFNCDHGLILSVFRRFFALPKLSDIFSLLVTEKPNMLCGVMPNFSDNSHHQMFFEQLIISWSNDQPNCLNERSGFWKNIHFVCFLALSAGKRIIGGYGLVGYYPNRSFNICLSFGSDTKISIRLKNKLNLNKRLICLKMKSYQLFLRLENWKL